MTLEQAQLIKCSFEKTHDALSLIRTILKVWTSSTLETAISELEDVANNLDTVLTLEKE